MHYCGAPDAVSSQLQRLVHWSCGFSQRHRHPVLSSNTIANSTDETHDGPAVLDGASFSRLAVQEKGHHQRFAVTGLDVPEANAGWIRWTIICTACATTAS